MPLDYLDTPATEREDVSLAQVPALDFSIMQPYGSPSKNPAEDLRTKMRGLRNGGMQQPPMRTPRMRNALLDRRNNAGPLAKQEFTPLLKSAKRKELVRRSIMEEKENVLSNGVPKTPAAFRSSYIGDGTQLPLHSSMIDGTSVSESLAIDAGVQINNAISSSMMSATPVPHLPRDGQGGMLEQGNVLTLRDQEAKLDQIQKENFGLKLKIHYLEEALRKTGSEFHHETLRENAELKTERMTIEVELKRLRKRLQTIEQELHEERQKSADLTRALQSKNADKQLAIQLAEAQKLAEARQRTADEHLEEIESLRRQLRDAEQDGAESDDIQALQDDIEDLRREIRDRDAQLDAKDDEISALRETANTANGTAELEHMQQDIDDLEAELKERDAELDIKNTKLAELEERVNTVYDREKSTQKLRGDVVGLESELRQKSQDLDDALEQAGALGKRLAAEESNTQVQLENRDQQIVLLKEELRTAADRQAISRSGEDSLRSLQRELSDKDGEIRALQERLDTARGSWDAEAQQADARMQEKDRQIRERDQRLRERLATVEQRDDELNDLQKRLRMAELSQGEASQSQQDRAKILSEQVRELEQSAKTAERAHTARLTEKDLLLQARESELKVMQSRLVSLQQSEGTVSQITKDQLQQLETANRRLEKQNQDHASHIASLERRAEAIETPSRKDALIKEYSEQVRSLRAEMRKIEQDKDIEMDGLEQELDRAQQEKKRLQEQAAVSARLQTKVDELGQDKLDLQSRIDRLTERNNRASRDESILGHQTTELGQLRAKMTQLEHEIDRLQAQCLQHESSLRQELGNLRGRLDREHTTARQSLEDEIMVLETALEEADNEKLALAARVKTLTGELEDVNAVRSLETPAKQRRELRSNLASIAEERDDLAAEIVRLEQDVHTARQQKNEGASKEHDMLISSLNTAQARMQEMQDQIDTLEAELETAREEKTIADERQDLHDLVKSAKIEAEQLQIKLAKREQKMSSSKQREQTLKDQLQAAQLTADSLQTAVGELEEQLDMQIKREASLRAQLKEHRHTKGRVEDLEYEVNDREGSSKNHARREAELRSQLREARAAVDELQQELAAREDQIYALSKRQQGHTKRSRHIGDDTINDHLDGLHKQLDNAQHNVQTLQKQLVGREQAAKHGRKSLAVNMLEDECIDLGQLGEVGESNELRHKREIRGLGKQIRFLQAKCEREERLRKDLVYIKRWFLLQVEMYNECNQADLRLLEDIGLASDHTVRESRPSLKAAGLTVIAINRMRKLSQDWRGARDTQEALVTKLESMKKARSRATR